MESRSCQAGLAIVFSKAPGHENLVFVNQFLKSLLEIDSDTVRISPKSSLPSVFSSRQLAWFHSFSYIASESLTSSPATPPPYTSTGLTASLQSVKNCISSFKVKSQSHGPVFVFLSDWTTCI